MFAVIKTGGKQYKVAAQDVLKIEKIAGDAGDQVTFSDVLMVGGDGETIVGTPLVDNASVAAEVVDQGRSRKIIVFKRKRRKNYRRTRGHRQEVTLVRITEILTDGKKPSKKAKKEAPPKDDTPAAVAAADEAPAKDEDLPALFTAPEGAADDLKKISGVGPVLERKLNALGITTFAQIAAFSDEDVAKVDEVLNFKGRIERDDWLGQARAFAAGEEPSAE